MCQGLLCPNLSQKVQKEVSQMANRNLPHVMLYGGLSVNLNHLKMGKNEYYMKIRHINIVSRHLFLRKKATICA